MHAELLDEWRPHTYRHDGRQWHGHSMRVHERLCRYLEYFEIFREVFHILETK